MLATMQQSTHSVGSAIQCWMGHKLLGFNQLRLSGLFEGWGSRDHQGMEVQSLNTGEAEALITPGFQVKAWPASRVVPFLVLQEEAE